ncbi:MAG: HAMP domain-containing sensor histidine kinase [Planctomycetota bacterium]
MKLRARLTLSLLGISAPLLFVLAQSATWSERRAVHQSMEDFGRSSLTPEAKALCEADPAGFPIPNINSLFAPRGTRGDGVRPRWLPPEEGPFLAADGRVLDRAPHLPRRGRPALDEPGRGTPRTPGVGGGARGAPGATERPPQESAEPRPRPKTSSGPPRLPAGVQLQFHVYGGDLACANPRTPRFPDSLRAAAAAGAERVTGSALEDGLFVEYLGLRASPDDASPYAWLVVRRMSREEIGSLLAHLPGALLPAGLVVLAAFLAFGPVVARVRRLTASVRGAGDPAGAPFPELAGDDEIAELSRAFGAARERAREHLATISEQEAALRRFVENTSHDVALPLTVLQGHLTDLCDHHRDSVDATSAGTKASKASLLALQEADYLSAILANQAAVARLEAAPDALALRPLGLGELVERVGQRHLPLARRAGLNLAWGVPEDELWIRGDVTLIEQALSNLVHNAVRYGERGGHVAVNLLGRTGGFELAVLDDGPGIDPAVLRSVLARNFRTPEARERYPNGQGLGMAIARDICERHGFRFSVESGAGRGGAGGLAVAIAGQVVPAPALRA